MTKTMAGYHIENGIYKVYYYIGRTRYYYAGYPSLEEMVKAHPELEGREEGD
jgi:hypothetical protein